MFVGHDTSLDPRCTMARREHTKRWLGYLVVFYCIMTKEIATQPVYTSVTGNANDALIVSNEQVYLQLRQTQRVPCGKQTGATDVIAVTWYDTKKNEIIRIVSNPIHGSNFTSAKYEGRATFTQGFDLTLMDVNDGDTGRYTCEIITATDQVDYEVEVIVIDKQLPIRSAVRSVSQLLRAGENTVHCPVYNRSITRPTIYYSIQHDVRSPTEILVSRFSDGSVLLQESTFDIQRDANYSLVIKKPAAAPAELLIWCHVSSDVDGVNLMSGFVNVTQFQPAETSNSVWIALMCLGVIILIILCVAAVLYKIRWKTTYLSSLSSEEMVPFNQESPINNESCGDYKLKNVIQKGGKKGKVLNYVFSSLRLVTVAGNGDLVMLDGKGIRVMSKKYYKKVTFQIRADLINEYVAIAASKRQAGEVLVARKSGKITWHDNSSGKEVEIPGCSNQTPGEISDMDVDDMGTIYVADIVKNVIYSYSVDGSFKSSFAVKDSPKCISACEGGILYVLFGTRIKRGEGYDIEGGTIKRYTNGTRGDYDIKCPTDMNIVTTGLYSSKTSVYVLAKSAGSDKAEASAILQFSALDGHLQRRIIDDWAGVLGIVFIRDDDELAFFDSKEVKVYERQKVMRKKPIREDSSSRIV
ncbi:uncharacterized protein LOC117305143 [Asterias rubens]|uniref:uncharacterized protein LOC117305143 n=1 Tax=Asterias rubens TaxID=7604 RepID=UPI0014555FCA|nr:uncharacterized protein LOC117305143 [Asterias rubens]